MGHGWEVVERYRSGQKGYEKTDTVPVIAEEKAKTHKTWYSTHRFITNFLESNIKNKKIEKFLYNYDMSVMIM